MGNDSLIYFVNCPLCLIEICTELSCQCSFLRSLYVHKARNNFESTRAEVERLMKRIRSAEEDFKAPSGFTMEGYLYIQEKREAHRTHVFLISLSFISESHNLILISYKCQKMFVMYFRSSGQCVDQILLYLSKELQDVHHEQHRVETSQQTGELGEQIKKSFK